MITKVSYRFSEILIKILTVFICIYIYVSLDKRIVIYGNTNEYCSTIKWDEVSTSWMNHKDILLSERKQM